jgi:hypothetical protein
MFTFNVFELFDPSVDSILSSFKKKIDKLHVLEARKQRQMDLHDSILAEVEALRREAHMEHEKAVKIRNKIEAFFN